MRAIPAARWFRERRKRLALVGTAGLVLLVGCALLLARGGDEPDEIAAAPRPPAMSAAPAMSASAPAEPLAGWILDDGGQPVAGARVSLDGRAVTTAADGAFHMSAAPGEHRLLIDGNGLHPSEVRWRSDAPPAHILVARRIEIATRVVRGGGRPAALRSRCATAAAPSGPPPAMRLAWFASPTCRRDATS